MKEVAENTTTSSDFSDEKRGMLEMMCENINGSWAKLVAERLMLEKTQADPVSTAVFRKHVGDHNDRIADLQIMFKTFIVTSADTPTGHLPFPEKINVKQTMLRYGKGF